MECSHLIISNVTRRLCRTGTESIVMQELGSQLDCVRWSRHKFNQSSIFSVIPSEAKDLCNPRRHRHRQRLHRSFASLRMTGHIYFATLLNSTLMSVRNQRHKAAQFAQRDSRLAIFHTDQLQLLGIRCAHR